MADEREIAPDNGTRIDNPQAAFEKPIEIVRDQTMTPSQKKKALETLEQDAHQLLTASNEGMAPEDDGILVEEPKLDEIVNAQRKLGVRPNHKAAQ